MPNLAQVMKEEIRRLARKEVKANTEGTRKIVAQYRHDIAQLKRELDQAKRKIDFLESQERKRIRKPSVPSEALDGKRFSPKWLKSHREKLGLSAADYAKLVGASPQSIYLWERGETKPREAQLAKLVAVRGLGVRAARQRLEVIENGG